MHQTFLHQAPNSVKEDLYFSYSLLLGSSSPCPQCMSFSPAPQANVNPPSAIYIKPEPEQSPLPKRQHLSVDMQEDTSGDEDIPPASQEEPANPKKGKMVNWETSLKYSHSDAFNQDSGLIKEARAHYFAMHPWDWTQGIRKTYLTSSEGWPNVLAYWMSAFLNYKICGGGQTT